MLLNHFLSWSLFLDDVKCLVQRFGSRPLETCSLASHRQQMFYTVMKVILYADTGLRFCPTEVQKQFHSGSASAPGLQKFTRKWKHKRNQRHHPCVALSCSSSARMKFVIEQKTVSRMLTCYQPERIGPAGNMSTCLHCRHLIGC